MEISTYCRVCLRKNDATAIQCVYCGASLHDNPNVHTTLKVAIEQIATYRPTTHCEEYLHNLPDDVFALFVMDQEKPLLVQLAPRITLGRMLKEMEESSVSFPDEEAVELGVSRRHAQIIYENEEYFLMDLQSTNGTWLNRQRLVPHVRYALHSQDIITLGRLRLLVCTHSSHAAYLSSPPQSTLHIIDAHLPLQTAWQRLTPAYMSGKLGPYLQAVADLQVVIKKSQGRSVVDAQIHSVQAGEIESALVVTMSSVSEAVAVIQRRIVPWREVTTAEQEQVPEQHMTLNQLAEAIITEVAPGLSGIDHMEYVEQLKAPLTLLANGDLTLILPESPGVE